MTHEASNGYMWYEVGPNVWIAFGDWAVYYPAETPEPSDDKDKRIAELEAENAALKQKNAAYKTALGTINTISGEAIA